MILRFLTFIPYLLNLDQSESMGFEGNEESKVLTSKNNSYSNTAQESDSLPWDVELELLLLGGDPR